MPERRALRTTLAWAPWGLAVVLAVGTGVGCVLDFPEEWLYANCGDGVVDENEECDDGDTFSGNGCSDTCQVENGYYCTDEPSDCVTQCGDGIEAGNEECDDGNTSSGDGCSATCRNETGDCGDGNIDASEGCDDSNASGGDGCSATCQIENGWGCSGVPSSCEPVCGDGIRVGGEACDDQNLSPGDGCSALCAVEHGWYCTGTPSICVTQCGDGITAGEEGCDDIVGTPVGGDGCSAACDVEAGWSCVGEPSTCTPTCGDGVLNGVETCDDSNIAANDGCSAGCQIESGWDCTGEPSVCAVVCGDGIVVTGHETCDDQQTTPTDGDGCSATCQTENGWTCVGAPSSCSTTCGDGIVAGAEACDDQNVGSGDGCSATCTVEANYVCDGEPSVCEHTCTVPEALFEQTGCDPGEMCTITAYTGGTYTCVAEGATAYYQSCGAYTQCAAGSTCANVGPGPVCLPYCDINAENCPQNGADYALCAYYYPQGQSIAGICAPNECDAVAQTGCSSGWCEQIANGVAYCNTDPAGTVAVGGVCTTDPCQPDLICLTTDPGPPQVRNCFELCRLSLGSADCAAGSCIAWSPPDPIYGYCD